MLQKLHIQNYVLIDDIDISFTEGLTIITGETGAGKTILLGALSLILGQRADRSVLRDKNKKCIIEGSFQIKDNNIKQFFEFHELDYEAVSCLRREISPEGKSRAFINDTPVNLNQLKELGSKLVDIHSQHETLTIQESGFQLEVVDAWCKHQNLLKSYQEFYKNYLAATQKLLTLENDENKSKKDLDYFQFLFNELEQASIKIGEQELIQMELETLTNADEIKSKIKQCNWGLAEGDGNVLNQLEELGNILRTVAKFNPQLELQADRIKSAIIELKDISFELDGLEQTIHHDPLRAGVVNERLNCIINLQQKHRVNSTEGLLSVQNQLADNIFAISSMEDEIIKLSAQVKEIEKTLFEYSGQLKANRKESVIKIETEITKMLLEVGMPNAQLIIEVLDMQKFNDQGTDKVRFLFSANKGVIPQELSKVASGGELSRLMLCIKSLMAKLITMPTLVFDEIDTGISGEIAFKVGSIIGKMSQKHQVVAITHLPQMASRGDAHLLVYKKNAGKTTHTAIKELNQEERIQEIAKMLSGDSLTHAAINNAKELLAR